MLVDLDPELAPPADRVLPLGDGRYELKATIDAECQQGLQQLRRLLSHVDPRMTMRQLDRPPGAGGARPPRPEPAIAPIAQRQSARGCEDKRPANSDAGVAAGCGATRRFDDEGRGDPRRRRSDTGAGGSADTDLRAAAKHPGGDGPLNRYRGEADGLRHSDGEAMRFGPRDFGGCQTTGVATRRRALQLRRSTDRAPLQLNASDRDRPHRSACAGRRRRYWEPQASLWSPSPPPARAGQITA